MQLFDIYVEPSQPGPGMEGVYHGEVKKSSIPTKFTAYRRSLPTGGLVSNECLLVGENGYHEATLKV